MTNQTTQPQTKQNNELYLLALAAFVVGLLKWGTVAYGILAALGTAALIFLYQSGAFAQFAPSLWQWFIDVWNWLRNGRQKEEVRQLKIYDILLGQDMDSGEWVFANLKDMKSTAVWGVNGSGKTTLLQSIVHFILTQYNESEGAVYGPEQIKLAISDLKEVDFSIYQNLPHLLCPIAETVEKTRDLIKVVEDEMAERTRLFKIAAKGDRLEVCNSLDRYHSLKKERRLDYLPTLPRILVIFEEISTFTRQADSLTKLILLGEKGRAYGITLFCCTQFPKAEAIPTSLQEQLPTRIVGGMSRRGYTVAGVYKEDLVERELGIGQWLVGIGNLGASYRTVKSSMYSDNELARVAHEASKGHKAPAWPQLKHFGIEAETAVPERWIGSDDDKRQMLLAWFEQFDAQPTVDQFIAEFGASRGTYFNWVPKHWKEWKGE